MSNTILENLRSKHEEVEQLEKALAKALTYKENNPKERVTAEIIIKKCIEQIQKRSRELISLYEDKDGLYREEIQVLLGKKHYSESSQSLLNKTSKNSSSSDSAFSAEFFFAGTHENFSIIAFASSSGFPNS